MNKQQYRVVFNRQRGQLMVVAETARARGGAASGDSGPAGVRGAAFIGRLRLAAFAALLAFGQAVLLGSTAHAQAVADPNAPGNQRPTVLQAPNGVPVVNIQTPSAAGVSRNTFSQFDVQRNGLILNNSRTEVQTQLGGWVQGNPWLATGGARVIVNEINSANPSQLRGYIEVAGQRAEVVIANAAGLAIDGGGFINASRVTLATGTPQFSGGALTAFNVQRGQISVDGLGLDASSTDYTAILARAVQLNAGVWASQLRVVTGANQIDAEHGVVGASNAAGAAPAFALDVAQLGGMYAGKITLVGTEAGVGVTNRGLIGASAGDVEISANGLLTNRGQISASGSAHVNARDGLDNSGSLYALADTSVTSQGAVDNKGLLAARGDVTLLASGSAGQITSHQGSLIAAGLTQDNTLGAPGNVQANATQGITLAGQTLATAALGLRAAQIDLSLGRLGAENISAHATVGGLDASRATLNAGAIDLRAAQQLTTDSASVVASQLTLNAHRLSNVGGDLIQTGTGALQLTLPGGLDNRQGRIATNGQQLTLDTGALDNSAGLIQTPGALNIRTHGQTLANTRADDYRDGQGGLRSGVALTVSAGRLDNTGGVMSSIGALNASATDLINTEGGRVASTSALAVTATGTIDNTRGVIDSDDAVTLAAGHLNNLAGQVSAARSLDISTATLANTGLGRIASGGPATVRASSTLDNTLGTIASDGALALESQELVNRGGTVQATGASNLQVRVTQQLDNSAGGRIAAGNALVLSTGRLDNSAGGRITAGGTLGATSAQDIDNRGGLIAAMGAATLASAGLDNTAGSVASVEGALTLTVNGLTVNDSGRLQAATDLTLTTNGLSNTAAPSATRGGEILGRGLRIDTTQQALNNERGTIAAAGDAVLNSGALNNRAGLIQSTGVMQVDTHAEALVNTQSGAHASGQGGIGSGAALTLASGTLDNSAGLISATGALDATTTQLTNAAGGRLFGDAALSVRGSAIDNRGGQIQALGDITLGALGGLIDNRGSLVRGSQTVTLQAQTVDNSTTSGADQGIEGLNLGITGGALNNRNGALRADQTLGVNLSGSLDNSGGLISAAQTASVVDGAALPSLAITNTGGTLFAGSQLSVTAAALSGDGKVLSQQDLNVRLAGNFNNSGELIANRNATFFTSGNLINTSKLQAGGALSVQAANIDNQASGDISATLTQLTTAGQLTNRGVIDGLDTRINAGSLTNLGSGRIYGDDLSISAGTLDNHGTIAARSRLDIGVTGTLTNRQGALIFSAGDLAIGGSLDANRIATGRAGVVHNRAATIESLFNLRIGANVLRNTNEGFTTHVVQTVGPTAATYLLPQGDAEKQPLSQFIWENWSRAGQYRRLLDLPIGFGNLGTQPVPRVGEQTCGQDFDGNQICTPLPGSVYPTSDPAWAYFSVTAPSAEPAAPTLAQFNGNQAAYNAAVAQYPTDLAAWQAERDNKYAQLDAQIDGYNNVFATMVVRSWTEYHVTRTESQSDVLSSNPGKIYSGAGMQLLGADLINDKSRILAGGALTGDLANLRNLDAQGQHIVHETGTSQFTYSNWRGGFHRYHERLWDPAVAYTPADETRTVTLSVAERRDRTAVTGSGTVLDDASLGSTTQTAARAGAAVSGALAALTAPDMTSAAAQARAAATASSGTPAGAATNAPATVARAGTLNTVLPTTSLYRTHTDPAARFLVETDPRFANYRQWLGSDYLLNALAIDPATTQKRLGDGFYEQRLIREQVAQLTGQRFLGEYSSDEEQYRALMTDGATFARAHQLRPGIALSAEQMAQLTSDIVWLVEQDVRLADGRSTRALVPQLYVMVRPGDVQADGTLIAGKSVNLQASGDLTNSASIAGRRAVVITADNLRNLGGRINAEAVVLDAKTDLDNIGGSISAGNLLSVKAGRDVNLSTTTHSSANSAGMSSYSRTNIDRVAGLYVSGGADSLLIASAGRDLNAHAAAIVNNGGNGATLLDAKNNLNLGTVTTAVTNNSVRDAHNARLDSARTDVGTQISAQGDVSLAAGKDLTTRAANVQAAGDLSLSAKGNILIAEGQSQHSFEEAHQTTDRGMFGSKTTTSRVGSEAGTAVASDLGGKTIRIDAGNDLTVRGSQVIGDAGVTLSAKNDIAIEAARNTSAQSSFTQTRTDGLFSSGGLSVTYGLQQQSSDGKTQGTSAQASTVGAVNGNVSITAGNSYRQIGSDLFTPQGDISVLAKRIDITEARETTTSQTETLFKQSGLTLALTSPVLSAVQTVAGQAQAAKQTSSSRMGALAAANSAMVLDNAAGTLAQGQASPDASAAAQAGGINLSISIGASQSQSNSQNQSDSARGSTLVAGGNITLTAQGGGQNSDITLQGANVKAGGTAALSAEDQINLLAAANTSSQRSSNKSSSGSIGVSVGSSGMGVTASASAAKGHGNGSETTYSNTHLSGNTVTLQSGGDTTLQGAVVSGNAVSADIGGNLKIESPQDSASYHEKQTSVGASVTIGAGASGSVSASRTKIDSEYKSVVEQSGIRAGDGGFQVNVKGSTELIGGAITSSDKAVAEGKNSFATTALTTSDLQNQAAYSAKSISVSAGTASGSTSASIGNKSDSAASTTRSGISGIAGDKSARTGDAESGLTRIFDAQAVKADVQAQVAITQEFGKQAPKAVADFATSQIKGLDAQIKDAAANGDTTRVTELNTEKAKWGEGGDYRVAMHATIGALSGGVQGALGAAAAAEAAPTIDSLQASLEKNLRDAGVNPSVAKVAGQAVANVTSAGLGMAAGGTGGAAMALNVDANNRQLHPDEEKWLKTKAKDFANQLSAQDGRPVSEEEALQRLGQQAVRQTDLVWRSLLSDGDDSAAQAFLGQAKETFANENNERQRLFTASGQQLYRPEMYADTADASFYRRNVQPGVTRTLAEGLPKEVKDLGIDMKNSVQQGAGRLYDAARNDPLGTASAMGGALVDGIKAAPGAIKDSFKETGTAIGEGLAVATDKDLGNKLNAIYGTDVSAAQQTLTGVRIAAAVSGAAGTAKAVTAVGDIAVEGAAKVVTKIDDIKAERQAGLDAGKAREAARTENSVNADNDVFAGTGEKIKADKTPDFKGNTDLDTHLTTGGPHGKNVYGAHNDDAYQQAIKDKGFTDLPDKRETLAPGVYENKYIDAKGVEQKKTTFDPAVWSDAQMQGMSRQAVVKMEADVNRGVGSLPDSKNPVQVYIDGVPFIVLNNGGKFYAFPGKTK